MAQYTVEIKDAAGAVVFSSPFTVVAPLPTFSGMAPLSGPVGTTVVISGANITPDLFPAFGGSIVPATITPTSITFIVPNVPV